MNPFLFMQRLVLGPSVQRWIGEPLRAVILSTSAFTTNKRGYPTLSKRHQDFITLCFKHNVQVRPVQYISKVDARSRRADI